MPWIVGITILTAVWENEPTLFPWRHKTILKKVIGIVVIVAECRYDSNNNYLVDCQKIVQTSIVLCHVVNKLWHKTSLVLQNKTLSLRHKILVLWEGDNLLSSITVNALTRTFVYQCNNVLLYFKCSSNYSFVAQNKELNTHVHRHIFYYFDENNCLNTSKCFFIFLCPSFLSSSWSLLQLLAVDLNCHFVKICFDDFSIWGSFHQEIEIRLFLSKANK